MIIGKLLQRYCLIVVMIVELVCASNIKWGGERWKEIIAFDGKGYYAYLPAVFIYHDLNFSFHDSIEKKYSSPQNYYEYRLSIDNKVIDKYFAGTALAELPFFLVGHLVAVIAGKPDGYSFPYQVAISLAGIFFGLLGLFFLRKILLIYTISENLIAFVIYLIAFGTQYFNYSVFEPSISHIYSFAFITILIYTLKKYIEYPQRKILIASGLLLGLITLIRPVNFLIIFILPFLSGDKTIFFATLRNIFRKNSGIVIASILFLITISIQSIIYLISSGKVFNDSYIVEHFIWSRPEMLNILFSYKKGLFLYTPIAFVSLAGLIFVYRKSKFSFWSFAIFFLIITYVFSCWWNWWYGGSFGSRPFVEYFSLIGILLALFFSGLKNKLTKKIIYSLLLFCVILYQVQNYQYRYFIIHWEKMDKEHYWRAFMRVDQIAKNENVNADLLK